MSSHQKPRPYFLCDNPLVKTPKYMGDTVATMDQNRYQLKDVIMVPCGKCDHCLDRKAKEWGHRMLLESKTHSRMAYVTLTFDDQNLYNPSLDKSEIQKFLKRLRKSLPGRKIRYYVVGEYGPKNLRKHYHVVLYGVDGSDSYDRLNLLKHKLPIPNIDDDWRKIHNAWKLGFSKIEKPKGGCFHYLAGYVTKISKRRNEIIKKGLEPEFRLMSKGLGKEYIDNLSRRIKQKKEKTRRVLPIHHFEYMYKNKAGKTSKVARGLGRWLKGRLHENIGMSSILDMFNKLNTESVLLEYLEGHGMDAWKYLDVTRDEREMANFQRLIKDTYG
mgnify:CR=1 FL=1